MPISPSGIDNANRAFLERLHRRFGAPFRVAEAAEELGLPLGTVRRKLGYLARRGWLSRVHQGVYLVVPLGASSPSDWRADPWHLATTVFAPGYVGGFSACEHWGLTEQLFRDVVVLTARKVRSRHSTIQGTTFRLKHVPVEKHFGIANVWRGDVAVPVSDAARTLVDILDEPALGGGIRHVAEVLSAWFESPERDDVKLLRYIDRFGVRSVYKRLGHLVEVLGIDAPRLVVTCRERRSAGLSFLDPAIAAKGRIDKRWSLRVNATITRPTS